MNEPRPIFVCGADRSGTSLMYALLSSHPDISMVRRSNMWRWFHGKFGDLDDAANLDHLLDTMSRYARLDVLEADWDAIRADLSTGPVTYGRVFDLMHRRHAERLGRRRWGDKSLHTELHADAVFDEFPGARIIHMVRDPRDRQASIANRYDDRSRGLGSTTGRWLRSARAAARNRRRFPGRYLVVRFEDLCREPAAVMNEVCRFVDEPFVEEMLLMGDAPDHRDGNSSFGDLAPSTISTKPIGRYRSKLEPGQIALLQLLLGREMRRLGYEPDRVDLAMADRAKLIGRDLPVAVARTLAWTARDRRTERTETAPDRRLASTPG